MRDYPRPILIIAWNTFREIIRDRVLYGIVIFAFLLFGVSLALGQLSFAEQARISADFGFTGIQLSACILSVFVGGALVAREIEKQTVLTLLARPVSRTQFIIGKYLGLAWVVSVIMTGLALALLVLVISLELSVQISFLYAVIGIFLEACVLMALALFFGSFTRPVLTVAFSIAFFLIGHWAGSLSFFAEKSASPFFKTAAGIITRGVPDLERFNWRSAPVYGTDVLLEEVLKATGYASGWILVLLAATSLIFRRRDFV